jgi:hypothetical protein
LNMTIRRDSSKVSVEIDIYDIHFIQNYKYSQ